MEAVKLDNPLPAETTEAVPQRPRKLPPEADGKKETSSIGPSSLDQEEEKGWAADQREFIRKVAERLNQVAERISYRLKFVTDRDSNMVIVKVLDGEGKVIREIPPSEMVEISRNIEEMVGLIFNRVAD